MTPYTYQDMYERRMREAKAHQEHWKQRAESNDERLSVPRCLEEASAWGDRVSYWEGRLDDIQDEAATAAE